MEKIAVFKRHFRLNLTDIAEAVGHEVSEGQLVSVPDDFSTDCLTGCSTLIFVGASKIVDDSGYTMRVPFYEVEDIAKKYGVRTIYRLANFSPEEGARQGKNWGIKRIDL